MEKKEKKKNLPASSSLALRLHHQSLGEIRKVMAAAVHASVWDPEKRRREKQKLMKADVCENRERGVQRFVVRLLTSRTAVQWLKNGGRGASGSLLRPFRTQGLSRTTK